MDRYACEDLLRPGFCFLDREMHRAGYGCCKSAACVLAPAVELRSEAASEHDDAHILNQLKQSPQQEKSGLKEAQGLIHPWE